MLWNRWKKIKTSETNKVGYKYVYFNKKNFQWIHAIIK